MALGLAACTPNGLTLEVTPRAISAADGTAVVKLRATTGAGFVGTGVVTVTSSAGSAREGLRGQLDAYGSFRAEVTCRSVEDPRCDTTPTLRLVAVWEGAGATAEASIQVVASSAHETDCTNGKDDDLDGEVDCSDADCDGRLCSPTDRCLTAGVCAHQQCTGGLAVTCTSPPSPSCQSSVGTCDRANGCGYPPANIGAPCDDRDACTFGDVCQASGRCVGVPRLCAPATDQCHQPLGVCDRVTGQCENPVLQDGTACDDYDQGRCCSGACTDVLHDPKNCGSCRQTCPSGKCLAPSAMNPAPTCGP